jgi:hypothetical protein
MIFTPEWVSARLFDQPEIETFVALMPNMPLIYQHQQVVFEVAQARLLFRPRVANDVCFRQAEEMASIVLNALHDTPLTAVGINIAFTESEPPAALLDLFNFGDGVAIGGMGWDAQVRRIVRKLVREGTTLNLTAEFDGQVVNFEFNYHAETTTNAAAVAAVNNRVLGLKAQALQLLDEVYHLQLPEGMGTMGETSMIVGSGTQVTASGGAPEVKSQAAGVEPHMTTEERVETRGLFVRVKSSARVELRVDTRLLTEQESIEKDNEAIRRRGRGS